MSYRACIVESNCSVWVCIVQTMPVLLGAILLRVSKHCINLRGSLENTLLDELHFYMYELYVQRFFLVPNLAYHDGSLWWRKAEEEPKHMTPARDISLLTSSFGHLLAACWPWSLSAGSSLAALLSGYCLASPSQMFGICDSATHLPAYLHTAGRSKKIDSLGFP